MAAVEFTSTPKFNHVAMSLTAEQLGAPSRADIVRFYNSVFGWKELDVMTEDRRRLILSAYTHEQFVFLIADDEGMRCPRLDHFGMSVGTLAELEGLHAACVEYQKTDPRVDIIAPKTDDFGMLRLTGFYVGYLLPMMVEVQHWEFVDPPTDAASDTTADGAAGTPGAAGVATGGESA